MENILQQPLTPFVIALLIMGCGLFAGLQALKQQKIGRIAIGGLAAIVALTGTMLLFGASVTAFQLARAGQLYPAPGKIVRVGSDNIHVWCEGQRGAPTVLLMGGGYSQGLSMRLYQEHLRARWRTCIVDRSGLGWSSIGQLPKTIVGDFREVHDALRAAGEAPAEAVVGHSAGGMFAAGYASFFRPEVRAIVLLDPTPPGQMSIDWEQRFSPAQRFYNKWMPVFATMFGLAYVPGLNPLYGPAGEALRAAADDKWNALVAWELRPSSILATIDNGRATHADPLSFVRTPGALEGIDVFQMEETLPKLSPPDGAVGWRFDNYRRLMTSARTEYRAMSSHSTLVDVPRAYGHYFPFTHASFALPQVLAFLSKELDNK